jgi:hypothetical protein
MLLEHGFFLVDSKFDNALGEERGAREGGIASSAPRLFRIVEIAL